MKPIACFLFLWFSSTAVAQTEGAEDTAAAAVVTKPGRAAGAKKEVEMGKEGGHVTSFDGKVELLVPAGVLSKKTSIRIQPITNEMPNGNGNAYRLEPSGNLFQKPIQLVFHYDEQEITDSMQLLLGITMQDKDGQWLSLNKCTLDTVAKTISGFITHFSDWSNFSALKIHPAYKRLKVKKSKMLFIIGASPSGGDNGDSEFAPLVKTKSPKQIVWKVNNINGGNATLGTVNQIADKVGQYVSPDAVPAKGNPVAVTAELKGISYETTVNGKTVMFEDLRLVSNILVYDKAYEVTVVHNIKGDAGSLLGDVNYNDSGRFVVNVDGDNTRIIEKENKNVDAAWDYESKCAITKLRSGTGSVHIIGAQSIKVSSPASPAGTSQITIKFIRAPSVMPLLQFKCPPVGRGKEWFTTTNELANSRMVMLPAFPQQVTFEAKAGEQVVQKWDFGGTLTLVTVREIKEDD